MDRRGSWGASDSNDCCGPRRYRLVLADHFRWRKICQRRIWRTVRNYARPSCRTDNCGDGLCCRFCESALSLTVRTGTGALGKQLFFFAPFLYFRLKFHSGALNFPRAVSSISATAKTNSSSFGLPITCTPIGNPSAENPIGTETPGKPARFNHCACRIVSR
jgi:hypothetical protein